MNSWRSQRINKHIMNTDSSSSSGIRAIKKKKKKIQAVVVFKVSGSLSFLIFSRPTDVSYVCIFIYFLWFISALKDERKLNFVKKRMAIITLLFCYCFLPSLFFKFLIFCSFSLSPQFFSLHFLFLVFSFFHFFILFFLHFYVCLILLNVHLRAQVKYR